MAYPRASSLDFTRRAELEEQMDDLPAYADYRTCLLDLDRVSATVLAWRPTLRFIGRAFDLVPGPEPLRVLDVACGDGAMLRRIARLAARRGRSVELVGVDLNPRALQLAAEFRNPQRESLAGIRYILSDVFKLELEHPPDVILSAHFAHHLPDNQVVRFLRWMETTAQRGWFINDLHRHPNAYRLFKLLGTLARWHPVIVGDGLISIRRSFVPEDWYKLTAEAGLVGVAQVTQEFPARVCVSRLR